MIAHREASDRWAALCKDGRELCTIKRTDKGLWEVKSGAMDELRR